MTETHNHLLQFKITNHLGQKTMTSGPNSAHYLFCENNVSVRHRHNDLFPHCLWLCLCYSGKSE